jgi:hypothetical protein
MTITSDKLSALIFLFFGIGTIIMGIGYGFGTPQVLGAGAVPTLVGVALAGLGILQLFRTLREAAAGAPQISAFNVSEARPLLTILVAVAAFGILVLPTGLVPALAVLVSVAWSAEKGGGKLEFLGVLVAVVLMIVAIFNFGLGLPIRLFAWDF